MSSKKFNCKAQQAALTQQVEGQSNIGRRHFLRAFSVLGAGGLLFGSTSLIAYGQNAGTSDSVATLQSFLKNVMSLRANFVQVVTSPNSERTRTSSGTFVLSRPNRFRFDYLKPYEQLIISDGKNLWLYDKDLEQVTQRDYSSALDATPAALLAGGAEATMAQENFTLSSLPDAQGLQWVEGKPRQDDGQINVARIGFRNGVLEVLEIVDNFRQKSTLTFTDVEINPVIDEQIFVFEIPQGVDLINE